MRDIFEATQGFQKELGTRLHLCLLLHSCWLVHTMRLECLAEAILSWTSHARAQAAFKLNLQDEISVP